MTSSESRTSKRGNRRTRSGTRREGDDYQDYLAIDLLLKWLGSNEEYKWFKVEADDALYLDDVTARKSDGTYLYRQVKYSTAQEDPDDVWDFEKLLARKTETGTRAPKSLLEKWAYSLATLSRRRGAIDAAVISNRKPATALRKAIGSSGLVEFDRIDPSTQALIIAQLGGENEAREFFRVFRFDLEYPGLAELASGGLRRFNSLGGNEAGWFSLKQAVGHWVCRRDEPRKGGRIYLPDIHRAARWYGLKSVPQRFNVPDDYIAPPVGFRDALEGALFRESRGCVVLTGPPGSGKSTFASDFHASLQRRGIPVIRHHYYLPTPGEYSAYQRANHLLAAESLMHDLRQDYPQLLGKQLTRNPVPSPEELRSWLVEAGKCCGTKGHRLLVVLDGLDHVWVERQSVDELRRLLGPLLPPPEAVTLFLVTQQVSDERLPGNLLTLAPRDSWFHLPPLDAEATAKWLRAYLKSRRPGAVPVRPTKGHLRFDFSEALRRHTGGLPLLLRYTVGALLERGLPLAEESLGRLPGCPSADITAYYRAFWSSLTQRSHELLHMVAACGFPWPRGGLVDCLELTESQRTMPRRRHARSVTCSKTGPAESVRITGASSPSSENRPNTRRNGSGNFAPRFAGSKKEHRSPGDGRTCSRSRQNLEILARSFPVSDVPGSWMGSRGSGPQASYKTYSHGLFGKRRTKATYPLW
jgi:hypothetical protein